MQASATSATMNVTPGDSRQNPNKHTNAVKIMLNPEIQVRLPVVEGRSGAITHSTI